MNPAGSPPGWSPPLYRSRIGASHRRRHIPCQDAALSRTLSGADGLPLALMAVADGHGSQLHRLSDVGSRLACQVAIDAAAHHLMEQRLAAPPDQAGLLQLQRWLVDELASQIHNNWLSAVATDWQQREGKAGVFSPYCYGTTLGLVMLTPHWWAHTGIGDWDLVLLEGSGEARLVSQEAGGEFPGETTASLCLPEAVPCFAERSAVYALDGSGHEGFGLVLSTDGVRKSCATDADHLALVRYLLGEVNPARSGCGGDTPELDACLDRITSEGSGDDVTVAMACFGVLGIGAAAGPQDQPGVGVLPGRAPSPPAASALAQPGRTWWHPAVVILFALAGGWVALSWWPGLIPQRDQPSAPAPSTSPGLNSPKGA